MADEPRVQQLLDEFLDSERHPGRGLRRLPRTAAGSSRTLAADARSSRRSSTRCSRRRGLTRTPTAQRLWIRRPTCRGSPAMKWRPCSAAAAWASSTRPGTCASTAPSPSRCCSPAPTPARRNGSGSSAKRRRWRACGTRTSCRSTTWATTDGRPYFTMEFVEGGSLAQKLAGTPQPARQAAALVATLAEAVQAAHQGGIVHRDLKPANVLLTADGTPKISRLRAGPAPGRRGGADPERRRRWGRRATWPPSKPGARRARSGRPRTCTRWGRSCTSC